MHTLSTLLLVWLVGYAGRCAAGIISGKDLNPGFFWGFNVNPAPNIFSPCMSVPIFIESRTSNPSDLGVPPYSMYAFEPGGVPHIQRIGSDPTSLSWTVDHLPGTKLLLVVLDSQNNTGGIPKQWYEVADSPSGSTACIQQKSDPPPNLRLSANVTDQLTTCEPWGLTALNGTPPYTVYLTAVGSDTVTVVKMGDTDNTLIYPNRVEPNTAVIASVRDSLGVWGNSTQAVSTTGSNDATCPGQQSVSMYQAPADLPNQTTDDGHPAAGQKHNRRLILIVAVVVGVTISLILILSLVLWWRYRQQASKPKPRGGIWDDDSPGVQDALTGASGVGELGQMYQHTSPSQAMSFDNPTPFSTYPGYNGSTSPLLRQTHVAADVYHPSMVSSSSGYTMTPSSSHYSASFSSRAPMTVLSPAQRKAIEARGERQTRELVLSVAGSSDNLSSVYSQLPPGAAPPTKAGWYDESSSQPSVIVQHLDGGSGAVQELPPPYIGDPTRQSDREPTGGTLR